MFLRIFGQGYGFLEFFWLKKYRLKKNKQTKILGHFVIFHPGEQFLSVCSNSETLVSSLEIGLCVCGVFCINL